MSENNSVSGLTLLGIAFCVLKLTGVINWSWWWVTLPFWGGFALAIILFPFFYKYNQKQKKERWENLVEHAKKQARKNDPNLR